MNTHRKGNRNQLKAVRELEANGWIVHSVKHTKFQKNDFFGLFDLAAKCTPEKRLIMNGDGDNSIRTRWIQVKGKQKPVLSPFAEFKSLFCTNSESVEIWCWVDREGFKKHVI